MFVRCLAQHGPNFIRIETPYIAAYLLRSSGAVAQNISDKYWDGDFCPRAEMLGVQGITNSERPKRLIAKNTLLRAPGWLIWESMGLLILGL